MAELSVIGLNHRTAPVEVRERLALPGDLAGRLLRTMHAEPAMEEAMVLATCNRTELYSIPREGHDPLAYFLEAVARLKGAPVAADPSVFYRHEGLAAARHLFRVAASLDSQIVGEHQILGQVKDAYHVACEARTAGFFLHKLLHWSFRVGKRVQVETDLGRGSAGIASAAVELAQQIFSTLEGRAVLLVGAGQMAEAAARALLRRGATRLVVANRTLSRAEQLAYDLVHAPGAADEEEGCPAAGAPAAASVCPALMALAAMEAEEAQDGAAKEGVRSLDGVGLQTPSLATPSPVVSAQAIGLEDIPRVLPGVDLVISSTGSPEVVLTHRDLAESLRRRRSPLFIVDIAVPRDVDERLGKLDNVFLYNIDDLDRLVARNVDRRRQEIPRAEAVVEDELLEFSRWLASLEVAPMIRLLREQLDALQQAHIDRYGKQFTDADRERLRAFTQTLCNQILHKPTAFLKELSQDGSTSENLQTVDIVRRLFGLDANEKT
ncbi:MAG: glutamyl-tRNA reductase [Planctomycetota bacterium]|nr:glutamyl-tRNA reductase [Planctomycetota bacterium]